MIIAIIIVQPFILAVENETEAAIKKEVQEDDMPNENSAPVFKKPAEISPGESFKRPRLLLEEEGRPTREISSVMMTTSGFLSPAREGKLPESRTPLSTVDSVCPTNGPSGIIEAVKKQNKVVKKVEKKKERIGKELFKCEDKVKKPTTMKDVLKLKQMKAAAIAANNPGAQNFMFNNDLRISPIPNNRLPQTNAKINKALVAARQKTEKLNTTITPIPMRPNPIMPQNTLEHVDKLFTEPDKKKVNILKKISNVKNEKLEKLMKIKDEIKQESRESSPDLIIDETIEMLPKVHHISNDITIELVECPQNVPEKVEKPYFDDDSPPGTPSTPKTPEMITHSPPLAREKRKRKDKSKVKKVQKPSPCRYEPEAMEIELERPKTPEAQVLIKQEPVLINNPAPAIPPFPFLPNLAGPGLIPPLNNPLYPAFPFPTLMHGFGQAPYMAPNLPMNFMQPKIEEPPVKVEKPPVPPVGVPEVPIAPKLEKKVKEHKKEKKEKVKKKNKKDKVKNKAEKKKLKEEKKDRVKKEKKEKRKDKEVKYIFAYIKLMRVSKCQCAFQKYLYWNQKH